MIELQLVVNGRQYRSLDEVPEIMRRLVARQLAVLDLSPEQLAGTRKIVVNVSKKLLREYREGGTQEMEESGERAEDPRPAEEPRYERPRGQDFAAPPPTFASAPSEGPFLGQGDPSPAYKKFLTVTAAALAALAFLKACGR